MARSSARAAGEDASLLRTVREIEAERRESAAVIRSEPRTYRDGSGNSYFADLALNAMH